MHAVPRPEHDQQGVVRQHQAHQIPQEGSQPAEQDGNVAEDSSIGFAQAFQPGKSYSMYDVPRPDHIPALAVTSKGAKRRREEQTDGAEPMSKAACHASGSTYSMTRKMQRGLSAASSIPSRRPLLTVETHSANSQGQGTGISSADQQVSNSAALQLPRIEPLTFDSEQISDMSEQEVEHHYQEMLRRIQIGRQSKGRSTVDAEHMQAAVNVAGNDHRAALTLCNQDPENVHRERVRLLAARAPIMYLQALDQLSVRTTNLHHRSLAIKIQAALNYSEDYSNEFVVACVWPAQRTLEEFYRLKTLVDVNDDLPGVHRAMTADERKHIADQALGASKYQQQILSRMLSGTSWRGRSFEKHQSEIADSIYRQIEYILWWY
ncbi:hypothetical protein OHC33_009689 [Knufia fluminis]|uniref:Uncharacterized protein n=1 Tax=Knufia fluminis TaxID=191047 RepID=A0AAN8ELA4_9EURO|nr:hypothetical protein OHC33_009689 [Knufia fluminis]